MRNMPIWKQIFTMVAMAQYLGSPLVFVVPNGLMVIEPVSEGDSDD